MAKISIKDIKPMIGLPGGQVEILGKGFQPWEITNNDLHFTNSIGWIVGASENKIISTIPDDSSSGNVFIDINNNASNMLPFIVPTPLAQKLHIVDNPAIDNEGNIYATFSGGRGETTHVSVYKISPSGEKNVFIKDIPNATSLWYDKSENVLYILSRFNGKLYKAFPDGTYDVFSQGLGVAFGLAMNSKNELYAGDRTGTNFKISSNGQATLFTSLPQSHIALHLGFDKYYNLFESNPLHVGENTISRIDKRGIVSTFYSGLSLFHGFVFDQKNNIYITEEKRTDSRITKITPKKEVSTILTGKKYISLSFDQNEN